MNIKLKTVSLPNGEILGYREREGGEHILLLIHGNMTSSKHWDLLIEALPKEFKVFAVDLRGFGQSSYHKEINSIKDFSDDLKLFVDQIGLKKFSICGWSTGGAVGMQFTIDYPEYVEKLILLASASTRGYPFYSVDSNGNQVRLRTKEEISQDPTKAIPVSTAYKMKDKDFLRKLWELVIYTNKKPNEDRYDAYLEDMLTQRNLIDVYYALNTFNISSHHNGIVDGTDQAKDIKASTLILWGGKDLVVTERMTKELISDLGENAQEVCLKNCGHSPLIDDLKQFVTRVTEFLRDR
jgi:pimeloyl-ACP methyl ester carboxylesterase